MEVFIISVLNTKITDEVSYLLCWYSRVVCAVICCASTKAYVFSVRFDSKLRVLLRLVEALLAVAEKIRSVDDATSPETSAFFRFRKRGPGHIFVRFGTH